MDLFDDDFEEVEELESLDDDETELERPDTELLSHPCLEKFNSSFRNSTLPFSLLDRKMRILWANRSFYTKLNFAGVERGDYLLKVFSKRNDDELTRSILEGLTDPDSGFSWRGRLETGDREHLTVIANALIFPLIEEDDESTLGYGVVFDDITEENKSITRNTFSSLLEASKLKDNDTGRHIERVNEYSRLLAEALFADERFPEIDREFIDNIGFLAAMHDVGKIGTPDDILNKQGPLDEKEWKVMQGHTINGAYILSTYPNPIAKEIALFHHERWDGAGYPYQFAENMIPLSARIVSIADVYDALRMKRSYKDPYSHEESAAVVEQGSETHFDPVLISYFSRLKEDFRAIYSRLAD
jgi:putative two-component system response regulator